MFVLNRVAIELFFIHVNYVYILCATRLYCASTHQTLQFVFNRKTCWQLFHVNGERNDIET